MGGLGTNTLSNTGTTTVSNHPMLAGNHMLGGISTGGGLQSFKPTSTTVATPQS
jgi:hypothetical protein